MDLRFDEDRRDPDERDYQDPGRPAAHASSRRRPVTSRGGSPWRDAALIFGVWLGGAAIFFRAEWTNGFHKVMGDNHDSIQLTFLMEHWFDVVRGQSSWQNPAVFYPLKDVLGWSESLFLFQVFYAPMRLLGMDMLLAAQATIILLSLVGFATFVCLARVAFKANLVIALAGGLAFTFANGLWLHFYWFQLLTIWMVPGIALLGVCAFRSYSSHPVRSLTLGTLCGALAGLAYFTSFYISWFATIGLAVAVLVILIVGRTRLIKAMALRCRETWSLLAAMGIAFVLALIPFMSTYLPATRTIHPIKYNAREIFVPRPHDLLNVGNHNVIWTSIVHHVVSNFDLTYSAVDYAVTPIVLTMAVLGSVLALWTSRGEERTGWFSPAWWGAILAMVAVVMLVLPLESRFGSLWSIVMHLPGASAVRRTDRIGVVANLPATLSMVTAASVLYRGRPYGIRRPVRRAVVAAIALLGAIEQLNTTPMANLPRSKDLSFLASIPPPPRGCRSFYLLDTAHRNAQPRSVEYSIAISDQIDAMLIYEKYLLPTINGYTSYAPPGWGLLYPFSSGYLAAVRSWGRAHNLESGLCQFDVSDLTWQSQQAT